MDSKPKPRLMVLSRVSLSGRLCPNQCACAAGACATVGLPVVTSEQSPELQVSMLSISPLSLEAVSGT